MRLLCERFVSFTATALAMVESLGFTCSFLDIIGGKFSRVVAVYCRRGFVFVRLPFFYSSAQISKVVVADRFCTCNCFA